MLSPINTDWEPKRKSASIKAQSAMIRLLQERFPLREACRLEYPSGGALLFAGMDALSTTASGFGSYGPVPERELEKVESDFRRLCGSARFSVGERSHPEFLEQLNRRGYQSTSLNMGWYFPHKSAPPSNVAGLEIRAARSKEEEDAWIDSVALGFHGHVPSESYREIFAGLGFHSLANAYIAVHDGLCVGGGVMTYCDGVANLHATALRPGHPPRGLGIQRALLTARIQDAHKRGAEIITSTTSADPTSASYRNLEKVGFIPMKMGRTWSMWRDF